MAGGVVAGCLCGWANPLGGAESCRAFLDGLRQRDLYDVALFYLDKVRHDPATDKTFLETIDFETGVTLLGAARMLPRTDREKQLDEARSRFEKFLADHPQHPQAASAKTHLAGLMLDRAGEDGGGGRTAQTPEQKRQLRYEARTLCLNAQTLFAAVDAELIERQKKYKFVDKNDAKLVAQRDQVRRDAMLTAPLPWQRCLTKLPRRMNRAAERIESDCSWRR